MSAEQSSLLAIFPQVSRNHQSLPVFRWRSCTRSAAQVFNVFQKDRICRRSSIGSDAIRVNVPARRARAPLDTPAQLASGDGTKKILAVRDVRIRVAAVRRPEARPGGRAAPALGGTSTFTQRTTSARRTPPCAPPPLPSRSLPICAHTYVTLEHGHPPWLHAPCAARRVVYASGATGPPTTSSSSSSEGEQQP